MASGRAGGGAKPRKKKFGWGGPRPGAGRKPKGERAGVSHRVRPPVAARHPLIVVVRRRAELPSLVGTDTEQVLNRALHAGSERSGFRIVRAWLSDDTLHLLIEAVGRDALSRGMQGLLIRCARALNRHWERKGTVWADRYEARPLRSRGDVRTALRQLRGASRRLARPRTALLRTSAAGGRDRAG